LTLKAKDPAMISSGKERIVHDAYFTIEQWVTKVLAKEIKPYDLEVIWEPACGAGHMVEVLMDVAPVFGSDIHVHPKIEGVDFTFVQEDFLDDEVTTETFRRMRADGFDIDGIISNPPYEKKICEAFVRKAVGYLSRSDNNVQVVAMLLRNDWDAASGRADLFRDNPYFAKKIVLTTRPKWFYDTNGSPRFTYAWYIWIRHNQNKPTIVWRGKKDAG
jgi:hypothetical protein